MYSFKMNKLKVLMVATTFPRWKDDSEPAFIYGIAKGLVKKGVEVTVLSPHTAHSLEREQWNGMKIIRFHYFYPHKLERLCYGGGIIANFKKDFLARIEMPFLFISEFISILRIVKRDDIDIVHSHWLFPQGLIAAFLKKILKFRLVVTVHSGHMSGGKPGIVKKLIRFIYRQADAVTANSISNMENMMSITGGDKLVRIPMGIDTEKFSPFNRNERVRKEFAGGGILLLTVARFVEVKGHEYLIKAMAEVAGRDGGVRLALIGTGPLENRLRRLVRDYKLEDRIMFMGEKSRSEIKKYFASSDIFVLPSVICSGGYTEGFGFSLLEALSSGVPVIATSVGGITDIVRDGENGLLVKEKDPSALSDKILELSHDGKLRERLGRAGLEYVRTTFSADKTVQDFLSLYKRIL
jgi:glycosyltransferase involved in cell wall biosynthesis